MATYIDQYGIRVGGPQPLPPKPLEYAEPSPLDGSDPLGVRIGKPFTIPFLQDKLLVDGQFGTFWLGTFGTLSIAFFFAGLIMWAGACLAQVHGHLELFFQYFANVQILPPDGGLGYAPTLESGGWWQWCVGLFALSVLCWLGRAFEHCRRHKWRPWLPFGFIIPMMWMGACYFFHPVLMGTWAEAPQLGWYGDLDWANNFSIRWGNFYYNPFHQWAIASLFGTSLLLGAHAGTILATASEGSHHEVAEIKELHSGSIKAMLFWKWTMGFNATPKSIHVWLWAFPAALGTACFCGIMANGIFTDNWYVWGVDHGTVKQYGPISRDAILHRPLAVPIEVDQPGLPRP